jgi:hypothetical protein
MRDIVAVKRRKTLKIANRKSKVETKQVNFMTRRAVAITTIVSLLAFSFGIYPTPKIARAADTGFQLPTLASTANDYNDWSNANNGLTNNNQFTTENDENDEQGYEAFNFSIPSGSTINGIEVQIEAKSTDTTGCRIEVALSGDDGGDFSSLKLASS